MKNDKLKDEKVKIRAENLEKTSFYKVSSDFIPYAFHLDEETIVTKNLQLLQIIKINSFLNKEFHHEEKHLNLRDSIRAAIQDTVKTDDFAFWIHTIRRKKSLDYFFKNNSEILESVNESWNKGYEFENQFVNELYITILTKGIEVKEKDVILKYFLKPKLDHFLEQKLNQKKEQLTKVLNAIVEGLKRYSPSKLKIIKRGDVYCSEQMEFFHKILNLADIEERVDEVDLSEALNISQISLSLNKFEIKNDFISHGVSTFTLKNYLETDSSVLDKVLALPFEFIIYQAFNFIEMYEVEGKYKHQYNMLKASKDTKLMKIFGLSDEDFNITFAGEEKVKYGESQISIIVIGDDEKNIEDETKNVVEELQQIGFVCIRDDVMIEDTFFGSLPGNFFFLRRMQPIQTKKIAGFASIDNQPVGSMHNNTWGDALALFKSKDNIPYFFNLHDSSDSGHSIFFGKNFDVQRNAVINFLELQSFKYKTRVFNIDSFQNTKLFNAFCGGEYRYLSLNVKESNISLNPCKLLLNENTRATGFETFEAFIKNLLDFNKSLNAKTEKYLKEKLMPFIKANFSSFKTISELARLINNPKITNVFFGPALDGGVLSHIFKTENDDILDFKGSMLSINTAGALASGVLLKIFHDYILKALSLITMDKERTIIKFDNFLKTASQNNVLKPKIIGILEGFKNNNTALIMAEKYSDFQDYETTEEDEKLVDLISTQCYMAPFVDYGEKEVDLSNNYLKPLIKFLKLTPHEKDVVLSSAFEARLFTIKHAEKIVTLRFDDSFSKFIYFFLASRGIDDEFLVNIKKANSVKSRIKECEAIYSNLIKKMKDTNKGI